MNKLSNQIIAFFVVVGIAVAALYFSGVFTDGNGTSSESETTERTARTIEILIYSDYSCPACKMYDPLNQQIGREYGENVILTHRHFVLGSFPHSEIAHRAVEAARQQGRFYDMHDLAYEFQADWSPAQVDARQYFIDLAEQIDLDMEQFMADFDSEEVAQTIESHSLEGRRRTVNSTPSIFIDGHKLRQLPQSYEQYKSIVELYMYRD
tara:strand:- start:30955 stop:31581 length:627 start_codon:yes stop_codon:yes gene_type:complete